MHPSGWRAKAMDAIVVLLVIAFAAHLAWTWLQGLIPALVALGLLGVIYVSIFGRRQ